MTFHILAFGDTKNPNMPDQSQHGETSWVLENLKPAAGIFCEVGAFDGIMSSNTLLLEELGWTGLCIEADPFLAAQCQVNRKCETICCAVGGSGILHEFHYPLTEFFVNYRDRGLSGMKHPNTMVGASKIRVPIISLRILISPFDPPGLDLLSIDTEGTELDVWNSLAIGPLQFHKPRIVIMEYKTCDEPPNDAAIVERMTHDGYKEVHRTPCNIIFTR